jgi:hypothetical protein
MAMSSVRSIAAHEVNSKTERERLRRNGILPKRYTACPPATKQSLGLYGLFFGENSQAVRFRRRQPTVVYNRTNLEGCGCQ